MKPQKRQCQKGFQHTGRFIEAVCLQPACQNDRLLCFYCIHQSHSNHSVAYLIAGLKSPLEMLNKNSQSKNPEKHMKYIQKKFSNINNAWLKISDNLENGINKIEQRMKPQFNVIRQTFKKNSVQQIIKQLTSNQITDQKIQQYVNMINMVKRYKFNDIKKLKFMTYMIQNRLSKILYQANNKISQIMNGVIKQTEEMNFINFNVEQLIKDRNLYLDLSRELDFYRVEGLNISSQTVRQRAIQNQYHQLLTSQRDMILIQQPSSSLYSQEEMEAIIEESKQSSSKNLEEEERKQNYPEENGHESPQNHILQRQRDKFPSTQILLNVKQGQQNNPIVLQNSQIQQNNQNLQSQSCHSNGFKSYKNLINFPYNQGGNNHKIMAQNNIQSPRYPSNQFKGWRQKQNGSEHQQQLIDYNQQKRENKLQQMVNEQDSMDQELIDNHEEGQIISQNNSNLNIIQIQNQKQQKQNQRFQNNYQNQSGSNNFQQKQKYQFSKHNHIDSHEDQNSREYAYRDFISNSFNEEPFGEKQQNHNNDQQFLIVPSHSPQNKCQQIKQINKNNQLQFFKMVNLDSENKKTQQLLQVKSEKQEGKQKENLNTEFDSLRSNLKVNQVQKNDNRKQTYSRKSLKQSQRLNNHQDPQQELHQFSCQFPSDQSQQNIQPQNQIRPSYQFSLTIYPHITQLQNKLNLNQRRQFFIDTNNFQPYKKVQIFDQNNQFQDIFCLKKTENSNKNTNKQFEILKKYFIFSKEQQQLDSCEEEQVGKKTKKRVKWAQDLRQDAGDELKQIQPQTRKRIKQNQKHLQKHKNSKIIQQKQQNSQQNQKSASQQEPTANYLPRLRSYSTRLQKYLQQQKIQKKQNQKNKQKEKQKREQKQKREVTTNQKNYKEIQNQKGHNIALKFGDQLEQLDIIAQQKNEDNKMGQKQGTNNLQKQLQQNQQNPYQQQEPQNQPIIEQSHQNQTSHQNYFNADKSNKQMISQQSRPLNYLQEQQVSDIINPSSKSSKQKQNISHRQNMRVDAGKSSRFEIDQYDYMKKMNYNSEKLDQDQLAKVSHDFLKKCQRNFIKHQNQTPHEVLNKVKVRSIQVNGRFHQQIKKQLSLIDQQIVQQLIIYCDTMQCAVNEQSIALICNMKKLTKLYIYWTYKLAKPLVKKLVNNLPKLQELILAEFQQLDTDLASQILRKLPNIRIFNYNTDYHRHMDKIEENIEFFIDMVGSSIKIAPLYILSKLKNLQNIWMSQLQDLKQAKQIITNMKNLKEVAISAFDKKNKDINSLMVALAKKTNLVSLVLQSLEFKEQFLIGVIKNNPGLKTLVINECPTVTNLTIAAVADNCTHLEQLFLMLTDSVQGDRIFELKDLKTLVIRACWTINVAKLKQGLKNLQNLKCLSLSLNNFWFTDQVLTSIAYLQNLNFLNIDTTKVTDKGMLQLVNLRNLTTLICGRTQITANGLFKFLQKSKSKIKKLGLSRQSNQQLNRPQRLNKHDVINTQFQGKYLIRIGQLVPQLTHLSIGGFKNLYIQNFATLDNLKCLEYKMNTLSQETQKFLDTLNLNLNANL